MYHCSGTDWKGMDQRFFKIGIKEGGLLEMSGGGGGDKYPLPTMSYRQSSIGIT